MPLHFGDQIRVVEAIALVGQRCPLVLGVKDLQQSDTPEESSGTEEVAQHGVENDIAIAAACQHLSQRTEVRDVGYGSGVRLPVTLPTRQKCLRKML